MDKALDTSKPADIQFLLYGTPTLSKKNTCTEIIVGDYNSLKKSGFNAKKKTKILIHGFLAHAFTEFPRNVKDAYFKQNKDDYNVICVNWGPLSGKINKDYEVVLSQLTSVAEGVTNFLEWLQKSTELELANVHLVGHSLGAHICGLVGNDLKDSKKQPLLGRISALDPAGWEYGSLRPHRMCAKTDATFVDVYHTTSVLGTTKEIGDVDFFIKFKEQVSILQQLKGGITNHSEVHRIFAQTILDGPEGNDVTWEVTSSSPQGGPASTSSGTQAPIILGQYCSTKTKGRFDIDYPWENTKIISCELLWE